MVGLGLFGAAVALLLLHLASVGLVLRRLARPAVKAGPLGLPKVTLLRPVCGSDPFDAETLASSFRQDYPEYEVIFCSPSDSDPATAVVRRLIAENPGVKARLLTGQAYLSGNPKLDNLDKGWAVAESDWICMTDSNLMLPPDYLRQVVAAWGEETGLVSGPAFGDRPDGWGGRLECAFLNGNQARLQLAADELGTGFAQGKTLFWSRPMLDGAGGLPVLGRWLAEDVASTKLVRGMGRKVSLTARLFPQPVGRKSLRQVWDRQLRWSRIRRQGFPGLFLLEPANGIVLPLLLLLASGVAPLWAVAFAALWYGAEWAMMARAGWPSSWRDAVAMPLRDALLLPLWITTFRQKGINWRGNSMQAPQVGRA